MERNYYKATFPRCRGVFPIDGVTPFFDDLNRLLTFNPSDLLTTDKIGDETRPLQPDRCVISDGIGGGVKLTTEYNLSKWAVGFRVDNMLAVIGAFFGSRDYGRNGIHKKVSTNVLAFRGDVNEWYYWDGTENTDNVIISNDTYYDIFMYSDGVNIHAYVNGIYKGYVTTSFNLIPTYIVNAYSSELYMKGDNYDYRLYDLSSKSATEINDYFTVQAPKFHNDTMEVNSDWEFHRYLMNEKDGNTCFDSGNAAVKNNGLYFYDDITKGVDYLHNTTLYPLHLQNKQNKEGWNKGAYFNGDDSEIELPTTVSITDGKFISGYVIFKTLYSGNEFLIGYSSSIGVGLYRRGLNRMQIAVRNQADTGYLYADFFTTSDIAPNKLIKWKLSRSENEFTLTFGGEVLIPVSFGEDVIFDVDEIGKSGSSLNGYQFNFNFNNQIIDPLNGSTIGTPTNIEFNKILIPNVAGTELDVFGRKALYKGIAKYNVEAYGGVVGKFKNGYLKTNDITINDELSFWFYPQASGGMLLGRHTTGFLASPYLWFSNRSSGNRIFQISSNLGNIDFITDGSPLPLNNWYKAEFIQSGTNVVCTVYDKDLNVLYTDTKALILADISPKFNIIGAGFTTPLYHDGYLASLCFDSDIYPLNGHAYNLVDGIEAEKNGVTFVPVDYTPQSTKDFIKYGGIKRPYGNDIIAASYNAFYPANQTLISNTNELLHVQTSSVEAAYLGIDITGLSLSNVNSVLIQCELEIISIAGGIIALGLGGASGGYFQQMKSYSVVGTYVVNEIFTNTIGIVTDLEFAVRTTNIVEYKIKNLIVQEVLNEPIYIPKPQFTLLPTDIVLPPRGLVNYPLCKINTDPTVWETYKSYGDNLLAGFDFTTFSTYQATTTIDTITSTDVSGGAYKVLCEVGKTYRLFYDFDIILTSGQFIISNGFSSRIELLTINESGNSSNNEGLVFTAQYTEIYFRLSIGTTGDSIKANTLILQEVTEHIDYPNRSGNEIANPTLETDDTGYSINNGDEVTTQGRNIINPISGVADYKLAVTTSGTSSTYPRIISDFNAAVDGLGDKLFVKFSYKVNSGTCILTRINFGLSGTAIIVGETLTGSGVYTLQFDSDDVDDESQNYLQLQFDGRNEFEIQIDNVEFYILETNNYVGHIPHLIFNKLAILGNGAGLPEIFNADMYEILDLDDPYSWTTEELINFLVYLETNYEGYLYMKLIEDTDGNITNIIEFLIFGRAREVEEQTSKLGKYIPEYDNLIPSLIPMIDTMLIL